MTSIKHKRFLFNPQKVSQSNHFRIHSTSSNPPSRHPIRSNHPQTTQFLGPNRVNLHNDNRHCISLDSALLTLDFTDLSSTTLRTADATFNSSYFTKYLSQALGVILIYDVTSLASFEHITKEAYMYLMVCKKYMGSEMGRKHVECVLVGNKIDLVEGGMEEREIDRDLAEEWASSQGVKHFEVSAKTVVGVRESVEALVRAAEKAKRRGSGARNKESEKEGQDVEKKHVESNAKIPFREKVRKVLRSGRKKNTTS